MRASEDALNGNPGRCGLLLGVRQHFWAGCGGRALSDRRAKSGVTSLHGSHHDAEKSTTSCAGAARKGMTVFCRQKIWRDKAAGSGPCSAAAIAAHRAGTGSPTMAEARKALGLRPSRVLGSATAV